MLKQLVHVCRTEFGYLHVRQSPAYETSPPLRVVLSQTEVDHFDSEWLLNVIDKHDVVGLEVIMNDASFLQETQSCGHLKQSTGQHHKSAAWLRRLKERKTHMDQSIKLL